jgi:hypothetical protein
MRFALVLALVTASALAAGAQAVDYINYPSSVDPAWLSNGSIRFSTNLASRDRNGQLFVVAPDGSGLRPATADEQAAPAAAGPAGESLAFSDRFTETRLFLVDAGGTRHLVEANAYAPGGAALSPDGKTVVFAQWVGWVYSDASTLYAVATDGSSRPVRLTPTACTLSASTRSALQGHCLDGSDGDDRVVGTKGGDVIIAGSGNDTIRAGDGQNIIEAQWGNDDIRSGAGPDFVWTGAGDDLVRTGAGSDRIVPGTGHDTVFGGGGDDYVWANDGQRDVVDCGPGDDRVVVDRIDVVRSCEHVTVEPPGRLPPVP